MRVLIVSDSHRHNTNLLAVLERTGPYDMLIHCGDVEGREYTISEAAGCRGGMVQGNNDFFSDLPREEEFQIGEKHIFITHGHYYCVALNEERLKEEARGRGADVVMYGHTHRPSLTEEDDLVTLNPGSIAYPRQMGRKGSYIIMDIEEVGSMHFDVRYCD